MNNSSISYELLRFKNSSDELFLEAMEVYRKSTSHDQKTDIKEITYWADNHKQFEMGELFFFGLKANGMLIGYSEIAYIKQERILIIDYINIAPEYESNSSFYSFYTLIMAYMEQNNIDYDYVTIEILSKHDDKQIRDEEVCRYELENFKIVNTLYRQPILESFNAESSTDAIIMIYTRAGDTCRIKKETYLHIVEIIYAYYLYWDSKICSIKELTERTILKETNTRAIKENINDDYIVLSGCPLNPFSKANINKIPPKRKNTIWYALFYSLIITGMILGILYLLKMMDYEVESVTTIIIFVILIFILFLALLDKSTVNISKKIFSALLGSK